MSVFAAINKKVTLVLAAGSSYVGQSNIGYALFNGDGTTFQALTTVGVSETVPGVSGAYKVELGAAVFTAAFDGYIQWYQGSVALPGAIEDIYVSDRLDVAISSRADAAQYTTARAAKLDQLDAAVSSRADGAQYTTARAAKIDSLDATVSSRADGAAYTAARAAKLDFLDAAVSGVAAAVWAVGSRTLTGFGTLVSDIWQNATRTLTSNPHGED